MPVQNRGELYLRKELESRLQLPDRILRVLAAALLLPTLVFIFATTAVPQTNGKLRDDRFCRDSSKPCGDLSTMGTEFYLPCLEGREILRNELGAIVLLDSDELNRRAITKARVEVDLALPVPKTVLVYVAIDKAGHVMCVSPAKNVGSLEKIAIEAARKWQFQPVLDETKPVYCMGRLELQVEVR
jgi:Gram-negative bacterial TonB protein C-terminal